MSEYNQPRNQDDEQPDSSSESASDAITIEAVMDILDKGVVDAEHGAIRWSSNYTFLTSVTHDDETIMAVYKPQRGERPLWDFPDGTLCFRERAAYLTSDALDWQIVPPTALRDGPRGLGSLQFFVDHDPEYNYFSFDPSLLPQLMRLAVFDVIVNNADRKGGHCIVDSQDHLWGIDHGITFHSANKLRTVIWDFADQPIPLELLEDITELRERLEDSSDVYSQSMCKLLSPSEINAFKRRIDRLIADGKYPIPGSGPNYPWPPV